LYWEGNAVFFFPLTRFVCAAAATDQEQVQATETNLLLEWNSVMKTKDKMLRQEILSKQAQETPQANGSAAQRPRNPQNGTASASDDGCTIM